MKRLLFFVIFMLCLSILGVYAVKTVYPLKYYGIIEDKAKKYNLDISFVCAVIHTESRFNAAAVSPKDALGLMQLTETTAAWIAEEAGVIDFTGDIVFDPEINIELGCFYLRKLIDQYGGEVDTALAAYNGGSGNVAKWLNDKNISPDGNKLTNIPFKETRDFVDRVNASGRIYEYLLRYWRWLY